MLRRFAYKYRPNKKSMIQEAEQTENVTMEEREIHIISYHIHIIFIDSVVLFCCEMKHNEKKKTT